MNKIPAWVWLVVLGGGAYAIYKLFDKGLNRATAPISDLIADTIIANDPWLSQPAITTTGNIVLPNGALVPTANIRAYVDKPTGQTRVNYQGRIYALAPHDANGNWPATPI